MRSSAAHQETRPFLGTYAGRRVLVTGHTGFKGAWLTAWLVELGANVTGYALEPPTDPSAFELCGLSRRIDNRIEDVRDASVAARVVDEVKPDFVFHLAAQSLVRASYEVPLETFDTNVMGTVNVLEAVRRTRKPCVVVVITSDKCYENDGSTKSFVETGAMGGHDPYGSSKACAELVVSSYRRSFFRPDTYDTHRVALASVRAGNVIGGGDWAADRIVPDIMRAIPARQPARLRNPGAVRPWQHVLDPLSGYLWLGARMLRDGAKGLAEAWNFGPDKLSAVSVRELAERIVQAWGSGHVEEAPEANAPHESEFLRLCCDKAAEWLPWRPTYGIDEAIEAAVAWYRKADSEADMHAFTVEQIGDYVRHARSMGVEWARQNPQAEAV